MTLAFETIAVENVALVMLAAGHSRRFGAAKLAAKLHGRALAHHAAATLSALNFQQKVAVVGNDDFGLSAFGFTPVAIAPTDQSASLSAGVSAVLPLHPRAIMVALADMPFVSEAHFRGLVEQFDGQCIASTDGNHAMPPALFGPCHFDALVQAKGDKGARTILRDAPLIHAPAGDLIDIDTAEQLALANHGNGGRAAPHF